MAKWKYKRVTERLDFSLWSDEQIKARMDELVPHARKTNFVEWAYMKEELAALRNEWVNRHPIHPNQFIVRT